MTNSPTSKHGDLTGQAAREQFEPNTVSIMPSERVTRLSLLRHGEVEAFEKRVVRGQLDADLSPRGWEQSRIMADWFSSSIPQHDLLFSSDLKRCRQLAELLEQSTGLAPSFDPRLREQNMGRWQGRTWEEITAEDGPLVTQYWDNYVDTRPPDGESVFDLGDRIGAWWNEIHARHAGQKIVVATHIGVIRSMLCSLLGIPLSDALRFSPAVGSYTSLLISDAGAVVESFGERPWLLTNSDSGESPPSGPARRIALSGSAGTGKTTLGRALAERLGVPFIEEGMRARLEGGLDLHSLDLDGMRALMHDLWKEQREAEARATDGFVADRSSLDFAAFWLHYNLWEEREETAAFFEEMVASAETYDRILLFPWGALPIENDGVRATNPWLQLRYQSILEGLIERFAPADRITRVPAVANFETRFSSVLGELQS